MHTKQMSNLGVGIIKNENNGFVIPGEDMETLVKRLKSLQHDVNHRKQIARQAHLRAKRIYSARDMVGDYLEVFNRITNEIKSGTYERPKGILRPPPKQVAGINIFPIDSSYKHKDIGYFPRKNPDYKEYIKTNPST
jgi:hypothetical protein